MITISLCMIVRDEEKTLARALDCVKKVVDEIIIVDTGSLDNTKNIAKKYTDKVFDFKWIDDFSKARNYSFSKATMEYCLWLDADDILSEKNQEKLLILKEKLSKEIDIVMMEYQTSWDENGNPDFIYYRERLIRNNKKYLWEGEIHEAILPTGNILYSDIAIMHKKITPTNPNRNIDIFEKMIKEGKTLTPRHMFYYARELYYHERYKEAIVQFEKFIDTNNGWIENKIDAIRLLSYCYKKIDNNYNILPILFKSFELDTPRAEICCEIGYFFFNKNNFLSAIYWYKQALNIPISITSGGFILKDCYDFIPYIQLCVCYDRIGEHKLANEYNNLAGKIKPENKSYKINKEYFFSKLNK